MTHAFFHNVARKFPGLKMALLQADMEKTPAQFTKQMFVSSLYITVGLAATMFMLFDVFNKSQAFTFLAVPIIFALTFWNFMKTPHLKTMRIVKEIDKEIIFVGKFMIVEIKAGVPIYQVFNNISANYEMVGKYFKRIVDDIDLGSDTQDSINKAILINPSENFQKVMWQISNSTQTGADISLSLGTVLDQINRRQLIEVERYGKKLNPIAMFYLMVAIIFPSLGMVMVVVLVSFLGIQIPLIALLSVIGVLMFVQFMFYGVIKSSRPAIEI